MAWRPTSDFYRECHNMKVLSPGPGSISMVTIPSHQAPPCINCSVCTEAPPEFQKYKGSETRNYWQKQHGIIQKYAPRALWGPGTRSGPREDSAVCQRNEAFGSSGVFESQTDGFRWAPNKSQKLQNYFTL